MNPLCQCGCGREVRYPQNKYIQGHGSYWSRQLTDEQVAQAKQMLEQGTSQAKVGQAFGVSASVIGRKVQLGSYVSPEKHSQPVVTQAEIDHRFARHMFRKANASLGRVRQALRQINKRGVSK